VGDKKEANQMETDGSSTGTMGDVDEEGEEEEEGEDEEEGELDDDGGAALERDGSSSVGRLKDGGGKRNDGMCSKMRGNKRASKRNGARK
jgi:hypothetical protein